jgi:hypothetical protein
MKQLMQAEQSVCCTFDSGWPLTAITSFDFCMPLLKNFRKARAEGEEMSDPPRYGLAAGFRLLRK